MLEVNTKAPDFTLCDKEGNLVSLSDFYGKKGIIYFYCTRIIICDYVQIIMILAINI